MTCIYQTVCIVCVREYDCPNFEEKLPEPTFNSSLIHGIIELQSDEYTITEEGL